MILPLFIIILMAGGLLAGITRKWNASLPQWISLIATVINLILIVMVWIQQKDSTNLTDTRWLIDFTAPWIPRFGISFHLALDGLSLLMLALTFFLGMLA